MPRLSQWLAQWGFGVKASYYSLFMQRRFSSHLKNMVGKNRLPCHRISAAIASLTIAQEIVKMVKNSIGEAIRN
jgi:hypothetical protein